MKSEGAPQVIAALRARSGFSAEAVAPERVAAYLAARARELGVAHVGDAAMHVLADEREYALLEAHFAPAETWLFRYRESFDHLREFARARAARGVRALVVGSGGWCEPCSVAAALLDGVGDACATRVSVEASDRNGALFARRPRFSGLDLRGGVPGFAERFFVAEGDTLCPREALTRVIAARALRVEDEIAAASRTGDRFDVIAFRNVAIYLDQRLRAGIFAGLASLLADDGTLLVGHAETNLAAAATGLSPAPIAGAFALMRAETRRTDAPDARRVIGSRATRRDDGPASQ